MITAPPPALLPPTRATFSPVFKGTASINAPAAGTAYPINSQSPFEYALQLTAQPPSDIFAPANSYAYPTPAPTLPLPSPPPVYLKYSDLPRVQPADVLVLLAHPDDEIFLSGTMAKLAQSGKSIQTVYVTNGKAGEDVSGQQLKGDALGMARSAEVARALADLGINRPPMVLDFMDGKTHLQEGLMQEQLRQILKQVQPTEILVHDVTGHSDHRTVNRVLIRTLNGIAMGQSPDDFKTRQLLAPLFHSGNVFAAVLSNETRPMFKSTVQDAKWQVVNFKSADHRVYTADVLPQRINSLRRHVTQYGQQDQKALSHFYQVHPYEEFKQLNFMKPASLHQPDVRRIRAFSNNPFQTLEKTP